MSRNSLCASAEITRFAFLILSGALLSFWPTPEYHFFGLPFIVLLSNLAIAGLWLYMGGWPLGNHAQLAVTAIMYWLGCLAAGAIACRSSDPGIIATAMLVVACPVCVAITLVVVHSGRVHQYSGDESPGIWHYGVIGSCLWAVVMWGVLSVRIKWPLVTAMLLPYSGGALLLAVVVASHSSILLLFARILSRPSLRFRLLRMALWPSLIAVVVTTGVAMVLSKGSLGFCLIAAVGEAVFLFLVVIGICLTKGATTIVRRNKRHPLAEIK